MIERLVDSLQALAAPSDAQPERLADPAGDLEDLVCNFDDALRLILDCPQIELETSQRAVLLRLQRHLDAMRDAKDARLWTGHGIREAAEWSDTREMAMAALRALNTSA